MFESIYQPRHLQDRDHRENRFKVLLDKTKDALIDSFQFESAQEKEVYRARLKQLPQDAFEVWDPAKKAHALQRQSGKKRRVAEEEDAPADDADETSFKRYERAKLDILTKGLELAPRGISARTKQASSDPLKETVSFNRYNVEILTSLLHVTVLRHDWHRAYNCFALLLRMDNVDMKSVWSLGLEILTKLEEVALQAELSAHDIELTAQQLKMVTNFHREAKIPKFIVDLEESNMAVLQEAVQKCNSRRVERYLNWLRNYYGISRSTVVKFKPAAWRSGSKTHVPLYFRSLVWWMLLKFDFKNCRDLLEELVLEPPFDIDGHFHFYLALCYQIQASYQFDFGTAERAEIAGLLKSSVQNYAVCHRKYGWSISYKIVKDLKKSLQVVGVTDTDDILAPLRANVEPVGQIVVPSSPILSSPFAPSKPGKTAVSASVSSSGSVSLSDYSEPEMDQTQQDKITQDMVSLTLSPLSQDEYAGEVDGIRLPVPRRSRGRTEGVSSMLIYNEEDHVGMDFESDVDFSSD